MKYLDIADVRAAAAAVLDAPLDVRDWGLLESALARPQATVFGEDAYPSLFDKAAALMLSLIGNHPFIDGNKRMGLTCAVLFLRKNGVAVTFEEDDAYDFVISVADGRTVEVADVARTLERWAQAAGQ